MKNNKSPRIKRAIRFVNEIEELLQFFMAHSFEERREDICGKHLSVKEKIRVIKEILSVFNVEMREHDSDLHKKFMAQFKVLMDGKEKEIKRLKEEKKNGKK